jgi:L-cysteine S-thiosulfotransferase
MPRRIALSALCAAVLLAGCVTSRKSTRGFHLPDGDPKAGEIVFTELRCHTCHEVVGAALPAPVADPPVPVVLGGVVSRPWTDAELMTAIVDPSYRLAYGHPKSLITSGTRSRMGDFRQSLTVQQLVDLVAFLQSKYEVEPAPVYAGS